MMKRTFSLNGIRFGIEYPYEIDRFADFFCPTFPSTGESYDIASKISIVTEFSLPEKRKTISNSIYHGTDKVSYFFNSHLAIHFRRTDSLKVSTVIEIKKTAPKLLTRVKRAVYRRSDALFENIYVQALRHAILFPYFMLLNKKEKITLSHGTAFCFEGDAFVIIGFDGIGKSSIAKLVMHEGGEFITDNFVLLNEKAVFCVPDPIRLIDPGEGMYYGKRFEKYKIQSHHKKIALIAYTFLGPGYYFRGPISCDPNRLNQKLLSYLPEFYDFSRYCAVLNMADASLRFVDYPQNMKKHRFYECQRSDLIDNKRMIDDLLSI